MHSNRHVRIESRNNSKNGNNVIAAQPRHKFHLGQLVNCKQRGGKWCSGYVTALNPLTVDGVVWDEVSADGGKGCAKCGVPNPADIPFCRNCGTDLSETPL